MGKVSDKQDHDKMLSPYFFLYKKRLSSPDKATNYRDYVFNLDRLTVYVSNKPRLDSPDIEREPKCATVSRVNNALFHPKLGFECSDNSGKGRYVYIQSTPVNNRWGRLFNTILCEVYVY